MRQSHLTIKVRFAWWLWIYLRTLALVSWLTGCTPDPEKVFRVVKRAMKLEVEK